MEPTPRIEDIRKRLALGAAGYAETYSWRDVDVLLVALDAASRRVAENTPGGLAAALDAHVANLLAKKNAEIAELDGRLADEIAESEELLAANGFLKDEIAALRAQVEWRPIELASGPDPVVLTDGTSIWIGYLSWSAGELEWTTSDESYCDLVPTHFRPLFAPPSHTIPSKGDDQ